MSSLLESRKKNIDLNIISKENININNNIIQKIKKKIKMV